MTPEWKPGLFRAYDSEWNFLGYEDAPQYPGQVAERFPPDWSPVQCFMANGTPEYPEGTQ